MTHVTFLLDSADLTNCSTEKENRPREESDKSMLSPPETVRIQPNPSLLAQLCNPAPSNSPGFPLAIDKEVVKEEEGPLLDVAC